MRTWHIELALVTVILLSVTVASGGAAREALGSLAVIITFAHLQVTTRLAEKDTDRATPEVECSRWAQRYVIAKEVCWFWYFALLGAWPALVAVVLFLAYPVWRRVYRSRSKA